MAIQTKATAFFGASLTRVQLRDDACRKSALERGLRIVSKFPGLEVTNILELLCAVSVVGPAESINRIRAELERIGFGEITIENPARPLVRVNAGRD